jgi:hypothetical protein
MARIAAVVFVFTATARALAQCPPSLATELTAADNAPGDYFGQDAAVSGDVAIAIALSTPAAEKPTSMDAIRWTLTTGSRPRSSPPRRERSTHASRCRARSRS